MPGACHHTARPRTVQNARADAAKEEREGVSLLELWSAAPAPASSRPFATPADGSAAHPRRPAARKTYLRLAGPASSAGRDRAGDGVFCGAGAGGHTVRTGRGPRYRRPRPWARRAGREGSGGDNAPAMTCRARGGGRGRGGWTRNRDGTSGWAYERRGAGRRRGEGEDGGEGLAAAVLFAWAARASAAARRASAISAAAAAAGPALAPPWPASRTRRTVRSASCKTQTGPRRQTRGSCVYGQAF